jgi:predicted phosphodiesterase
LIDRFTWLHVSDFHFTADADPFSQTVACDALLADVAERANEHGSISFVLITGDLAFSGQPQEYLRAAEFMKKLSSRLSIKASNFFFVPGNHDVDRKLHSFAPFGARHVLSSEQAVDLALSDPARIADLAARQNAYREFVENFTQGQERTETPNGLGYVAKIPIESLTVAVAGLNSAWMCGDDGEEKSLIIGERQVIEVLNLVGELDPHVVIALTHHPLEWLTEWDQASCRTRLLTGAHFLHRGHLHQADVSTFPQRRCVLVAAGSAHASRFYPNSYNIVSVDLAAGLSTVHQYTYRLEDHMFEPGATIQTRCELGGDVPGTSEDLVDAIAASAANASEYAGYMAALLLGQKDEIPLEMDGKIIFVTSGMARDSDPDQAATANAFLGLRNLLRLHRDDLSLAERVAEHAALIEEFATWLSRRADADTTCRARVSEVSPGSRPDGTAHTMPMPHTAALLADLAARQDWELLEAQARRALVSSDPALTQLARRMLAEALMHSDEAPKRAQAVDLAEQLVADTEATVEDYLLAAAASEVHGAPDRSVALVGEAIDRWPSNARLVSYARDLMTRTGDVALRAVIDIATGSTAHE